MSSIRPLEQITSADLEQFGGKTVALARLAKDGYLVPRSLCLSCNCYRQYLAETRLDSRLTMELGRKDFDQMRWEELWDAALRIRNLFLKTPFPEGLETEIRSALTERFGAQPLVIRSSAPGEDSGDNSFAGLHDSFVNVCSIEDQLLAIRKVWASLWSDRALLYRQELGLSVAKSCMAVLVQGLISGEKSGVAFSVAPTDPRHLVIEAVWGLNQGLVDGSIEPDGWSIDRVSLDTVDYRPAQKSKKLVAQNGRLQTVATSMEERDQPVLDDMQRALLAETVLALEKAFSRPQDCEWTWQDNQLVLLQSRPITATHETDARSWYLNLHRSFENLRTLQQRIETEILPGMESAADRFAGVDLALLGDDDLCTELENRLRTQQFWEESYRIDCIPMAHGIRLFGEFYNDQLRPLDPFEFIELLRGGELRAVDRNRRLKDLALSLAADSAAERDAEIDLMATETGLTPGQLHRLLQQLARQPRPVPSKKRSKLEQAYRSAFTAAEWPQASQLLEIGRSSYRLRDDDNISLGRLVREVKRAVSEMRRRNTQRQRKNFEVLLHQVEHQEGGLSSSPPNQGSSSPQEFRARQLQGQPAGPGLATAPARVIHTPEQLSEFRQGEILVCDAIDPAMTFVVPLAVGIIERRGGMLIHGAIIAREYGIPCVSGIPDAADIISTGDLLTIDGDLGLVFFPPSSGQLVQPKRPHQLRKELDDVDEVD